MPRNVAYTHCVLNDTGAVNNHNYACVASLVYSKNKSFCMSLLTEKCGGLTSHMCPGHPLYKIAF